MIDLDIPTRLQIARQISHWTMAASRLRDLEDLASPIAWDGLERYLGVVLVQIATINLPFPAS